MCSTEENKTVRKIWNFNAPYATSTIPFLTSKTNITVFFDGGLSPRYFTPFRYSKNSYIIGRKSGAYKGLHQIHQRCNLSFVEESIEYFR